MKRIVTLLLLTVSINAISGQYIQPKVWRMAGDSSAVVRSDGHFLDIVWFANP